MPAQKIELVSESFQELATKIFPELWLPNSRRQIPGQRFVPFLGAGASLPPASSDPGARFTGFPEKAKIEAVLAELNLSEPRQNKRERMIVQFSLALAYLMVARSRQIGTAAIDIRAELLRDAFPPSAAKLADFFARVAGHRSLQPAVTSLMENWPEDWDEPKQEPEHEEWMKELEEEFKLLVESARLWGVNDALTSIAARYEVTHGRKDLWHDLADIFKDKKSPTKTHLLIADAARHHLTLAKQYLDVARQNRLDVSAIVPHARYLIITTNYDRLIEEALGADTPWVVLYVKRPTGQAVDHVSFRFSDYFWAKKAGLERGNSDKAVKGFNLEVDEPIVVIFKVHGCLHPEDTFDNDSVIITDFDYEDYIARMGISGELMVPSAVSALMNERSFLFMGYSLSDWNVRTILTTLIRKRIEGSTSRDHAVMKETTTSADAYCERRGIAIVPTTLDSFADEIQKRRPPPPAYPID
ncbi:MAG: SIR2 family protein [Acidobacteriota bacterium]|nr:SIR2 family protein [Acidobacteriota bacterium]